MNNIEYLPGFEAGSKINLDDLPSSRFEKKNDTPRPESYLLPLRDELRRMSERLNAEHGDFFAESGQISMSGQGAEDDLELIAEKELAWAEEQKKNRTLWRQDRAKNSSEIAEQALTLLFDRIFREDFIIVRASVYDDYKNGADLLIIDKQSGAIICGLDDVLGNKDDDGGSKKAAVVSERMAGGGTTVKYGLNSYHGQLERRVLRNVPLFYFSLSKKELDDLLAGLRETELDPTGPPHRLARKLVESLAEQSSQYVGDNTLAPRLQENLAGFRPSLEKMLNQLRKE